MNKLSELHINIHPILSSVNKYGVVSIPIVKRGKTLPCVAGPCSSVSSMFD